jgi:hypothetical protein
VDSFSQSSWKALIQDQQYVTERVNIKTIDQLLPKTPKPHLNGLNKICVKYKYIRNEAGKIVILLRLR